MSVPRVLDQSGDLNLSELHRYNQLYGFPDYVKNASQSSYAVPPERKPTLFADPRNYQFPLHSKAATYVSQVFFLERQAEVHPKLRGAIQERIDKVAQFFGIASDLAAVKEKYANAQRDTTPDSAYAIVTTNAVGEKERRYPLRNTMEVSAAAKWYCERQAELREQYPYSDRQRIADRILDRADQLSAHLPETVSETLQKAAGRGRNSPQKIAEAMRSRVKAAAVNGKAELKLMFNKLADNVANKPSAFLDPATLTQLAETIEMFDRETRLLNKYSAAIPPVEDLVFGVTFEKLAYLHDHSCQTLTGSVYTNDQFAKLSVSEVRDMFGDEVAEQVTKGLGEQIDPEKFAEIAGTFPRPDAVALDDLMQDKGLDPLQKDAQAIGFSYDELRKMAVL